MVVDLHRVVFETAPLASFTSRREEGCRYAYYRDLASGQKAVYSEALKDRLAPLAVKMCFAMKRRMRIMEGGKEMGDRRLKLYRIIPKDIVLVMWKIASTNTIFECSHPAR